MRPTFHGVTTAAVLLLLASGAAPPAAGCGFDRLLGDGFSAEHSKSIAVAFAISDAVTSGLVDKTVLAPIVPGLQGYWRAVGRINTFQRLLSAANAGGAHSAGISLLFIDSRLWARLSPGPQGYELQVHTSGALPEDVVIITSEAILAGVLDGAMPAQQALDLGLIAIEGTQKEADVMRRIVAAAMNREDAAIVAGSHAIPIRLFGPAR